MKALLWASVAGFCHGTKIWLIATNPLIHTDIGCTACDVIEPWVKWEKKARQKAFGVECL